MNYTLKNDFISITLCDQGAELHSIKGKGEDIEFLWNGDENYWKYHAPVLFPIVGKVIDDKYKVDGITYSLPQHGLARLSKFNVVDITNSSISFRLDYSQETLKVYPFKFSLVLEYILNSNSIIVNYRVTNTDSKEILFSIGAHPAFMCPIFSNENFEDYYFEFKNKEIASIMKFSNLGYLTNETIPYLNNDNIIPLSTEVFKKDALIFDNLTSRSIALKTSKHNKFIEFDFTGFPYLALWSKPTGAPFVCIEPWFGHADFEGFNGELKDKAGIISLKVNEEFSCSYTIRIHQ